MPMWIFDSHRLLGTWSHLRHRKTYLRYKMLNLGCMVFDRLESLHLYTIKKKQQIGLCFS